MYLQEILEVAIGLVFMWMVISIAAMSIQEWVANLLQWRSNDMEIEIRRMITGENAQANQAIKDLLGESTQNLADLFYDHPLIKSLSKEPTWLMKLWVDFLNLTRSKANKLVPGRPSYIPSSKFSLALFDIVMNAGTDQSPIKLAAEQFEKAFAAAKTELASLKDSKKKKIFGDALKQALEDVKRLAGTPLGDQALVNIKGKMQSIAEPYPEAAPVTAILLSQIDQYYQQVAAAQKQQIANAKKQLADAQNMTGSAENTEGKELERLRVSIAALGAISPELMKSLRSLVTGVEGFAAEKEKGLAVARKNIESWFDDSMTRLSGWYKRKAQFTAFLIGLFLGILLNVDSINVANSLWREPTLRQTIVAQAQSYVQQNQSLPSGETGTTTPKKSITDLQQELTALNIPFGWERGETIFVGKGQTCLIIPIGKNTVWGVWSDNACKKIANAPADTTGWLVKLAGILITALAAAQGAPFWFDILKKLVNVRSSGSNPAEEKPKG